MRMLEKVCCVEEIADIVGIYEDMRIYRKIFGCKSMSTIDKWARWILSDSKANLHPLFITNAVIHEEPAVVICNFRRPVARCSNRQRFHGARQRAPVY